jgi:transposase
VPVEEVGELHEVKPERCGSCEGALRGEDAEPVRRQVVELPEMKPLVIEYRLHALCCRRCGATTRAELPNDAPRLGFGARLCAMVALLTGKCRLSKRTTQTLLEDGFGVDVGLGSISNIEREMSRSIEAAVEVARAHVRGSPVVHPDETSWREGRRNAWLWTAATPGVTVFRIDQSRSGFVARTLLGAEFDGVAVSDRFSGYNWLPIDKRQICWAHLRRDFQEMVDRRDEGSWVGAALLGHIRSMFRWWRQLRDGEMKPARFQERMRIVERRVGTDLVIGSTSTSSKTGGTCAELLKLEPALWTFVREPGVEPTNNRAERASGPRCSGARAASGRTAHSAAASSSASSPSSPRSSSKAATRSTSSSLRSSRTVQVCCRLHCFLRREAVNAYLFFDAASGLVARCSRIRRAIRSSPPSPHTSWGTPTMRGSEITSRL